MNQESIEEETRSEQSESTVQSRAATTAHQGEVAMKSISFKALQIAGGHHIMFGRGRACSDNPGNQRMRRIIEKYKGQYMATGKRAVKRFLVRKTYDEIAKGGVMFLKQVGNDDKWVPVEQEFAINKVSHTLRCRKILGEEAGITAKDSARGSGAAKKPPPASSSSRKLSPAMISHEAMVPAEVIHHHHLVASTASTSTSHNLEGDEVVRQTTPQQQASLYPDHDSLLTRSLLIRQLQIERMRTEALIRSRLQFLQRSSLASELEALQEMERRDEEVRRVLASRGDTTFPGI